MSFLLCFGVWSFHEFSVAETSDGSWRLFWGDNTTSILLMEEILM